MAARPVLLDVMMPIVDGFAFRAAQQQTPDLADTPVIVISAIQDHDVIRRRIGPAATVPKPIELAQLLDCVAEYCDDAPRP